MTIKQDPVIGDCKPTPVEYLWERTIIVCPSCGCQRLLREWNQKIAYELLIRGCKYGRERTIWGEIEDGVKPQPYLCPNCETRHMLKDFLPEWQSMKPYDPYEKTTLIPYINPAGFMNRGEG